MLSSSIEKNLGGRRRNFVWVALAIALGGVSWIGLQRYQALSSTEPTSSEEIVVPEIKTVTALGQLQPKGETIRLSAPVSGGGGSSRIAELRVTEGAVVESGQVIAVLDSRDRLQAAVSEAKSQINIAQAKLAQVKAGSQQGTINAQSAELGRIQADIQGNEIEQREAIARLEAQFEGDLASQQANLQRLKATYQNAKIEAQRYRNLHREGAVSDSQRDSRVLTYESTEQQVKEAEAVITRTEATAQRQIKEAQARLVKIQAAGRQQVEQAEATLDRVSEVRPVDVLAAQAEVDRANAILRQAEVSLEEAYVRSPQAGVILEVFTRPGEVVGNDGIVEIGKTQQMYAIAEIYQSDIAKVKPGMKATVKSDSLSDELQGRVERIDAKIRRQNVVSSDPTDNIDSRVLTYESTEQQVKEAEAVITRTEATAQRQIKEAQARLVKIQAAGRQQVEQAEATLDRVSEVRPVDVLAAQAEVDRANAILRQAEVSLEEAYVRSPQAGVILEVFTRPGEVVGNDGIVEIGKTQQMYAIAEIYQSDIAKVKPGMKATVKSDSLSDELQGRVERIDAKIRRQNVVSSDPTDNIDSRVVEAHIRLDGASSQRVKNYTNLQVKVVIQQ